MLAAKSCPAAGELMPWLRYIDKGKDRWLTQEEISKLCSTKQS